MNDVAARRIAHEESVPSKADHYPAENTDLTLPRPRSAPLRLVAFGRSSPASGQDPAYNPSTRIDSPTSRLPA